jgi:hypothetical protein
MPNFTFISLESQVSGTDANIEYSFDSATTPFVIPETNGTISIGNLSLRDEDRSSPGYLTGRRPAKGQLFPRGVYNK